MPLITAIRQQQKRSDRYSIFIDGRYALSLSAEQLESEGLRPGTEIEERYALKLTELSQFGKFLDRCYNYLAVRDRSVKEIKDYLFRKGCDEDATQAIIERLLEQKFLDDERFAVNWVRDRREFGHHSKQRIIYELRSKGIDNSTIEASLMGMNEIGEVEQVTAQIKHKNLLNRYPDQQKLIQALQRKGFRYSDIKAALEQLLEN